MSTANWIKLRVNVWDKAEVQYIAESCGIPIEQAVGVLCRLWTWFDQHTEKGVTNKFGTKLVGKYTRTSVTDERDEVVTSVMGVEILVTPFLEAMQEVEWINLTNEGFWALTNWEEHNGETAKTRASNQKRQAKSRANKEQDNLVTDKRDKSVTREEKRREENKENKTLLVNPTDRPKAKNEALLASYRKGFDMWWELYDKKTHKQEALKKWLKLSEEEMKKAIAVVEEYTTANEKIYRKDPHRYLAHKSFNDEIIHKETKQSQGMKNLKGIFQAEAQRDSKIIELPNGVSYALG